MKTLFKITRSIIASLLFLILTFAVIIQFTFTLIHKEPTKIPDKIPRHELLYKVLDNTTLEPETEKIAIEYIDDYLNYIFYKRSYPSTQTIDFDNLPEDQIANAKNIITQINKKIEIEYDSIVKIRNINNTISNGSIYLMVNIALFIIFLLFMIVTFSPAKSFLFLGLSTILGALLSLIALVAAASNIENWFPPSLSLLLDTILSKEFLGGIHTLTIIYVIIGLILFLSAYIYTKRELFKKQNSTK